MLIPNITKKIYRPSTQFPISNPLNDYHKLVHLVQINLTTKKWNPFSIFRRRMSFYSEEQCQKQWTTPWSITFLAPVCKGRLLLNYMKIDPIDGNRIDVALRENEGSNFLFRSAQDTRILTKCVPLHKISWDLLVMVCTMRVFINPV
jgi:hypothetical protein